MGQWIFTSVISTCINITIALAPSKYTTTAKHSVRNGVKPNYRGIPADAMSQPAKPTGIASNNTSAITNAPNPGSSPYGGPSKQSGVNVVTSEANPKGPASQARKDEGVKKTGLLGSITKRRQAAVSPSSPQPATSSPKPQSSKGKTQESVPAAPGSSTSLPLKGVKEAPKPKVCTSIPNW